MANPKAKDILAAIVTLWTPVADKGVVITRERFSKNQEGYADLFTSLTNDGKAHGVMIQWTHLRQAKGSGFCAVRKIYGFDIEVLYPYQDKAQIPGSSPAVFTTSDDLFKNYLLESLNDALNAVVTNQPPWDLGMSAAFPQANVEHNFLQAVELPFMVESWGEGTAGVSAHYAHFTLDVGVTANVHP
jgi:hypothetical protein